METFTVPLDDPEWRARCQRVLLRMTLNDPVLQKQVDTLDLAQPGDDLLLRDRAQRGLVADWESALPWWSAPSLLAWVLIPGIPAEVTRLAMDRILADPLARNTLCLNSTSLLALPDVERRRAIEAFLLAMPDPLPLFGNTFWHVLANLMAADPAGADFYHAAQMLIDPPSHRWEFHALQMPRDMRWALLRLELAEQAV